MTEQTLGGRPVLSLKSKSTRPPVVRPADEPSVADKRRLVKKILNRSSTWRDCRPLAIGFHRIALQYAPAGMSKQMRAVINFHCTSPEYLRTLAAGGDRYNWDGQPDGVVTPEAQARAVRKLQEAEQ